MTLKKYKLHWESIHFLVNFELESVVGYSDTPFHLGGEVVDSRSLLFIPITFVWIRNYAHPLRPSHHLVIWKRLASPILRVLMSQICFLLLVVFINTVLG